MQGGNQLRVPVPGEGIPAISHPDIGLSECELNGARQGMVMYSSYKVSTPMTAIYRQVTV